MKDRCSIHWLPVGKGEQALERAVGSPELAAVVRDGRTVLHALVLADEVTGDARVALIMAPPVKTVLGIDRWAFLAIVLGAMLGAAVVALV